MDTLIRDVRYALTTMRRNKGFAAAGLLTLALGIGATTAVFSVVHGVPLRPRIRTPIDWCVCPKNTRAWCRRCGCRCSAT